MNILVYTSIYPGIGDKSDNTKVVHYFCRSWVNAGHCVHVINNVSKFPSFYYLLTNRLSEIFKSTFSVIIPDVQDLQYDDYNLDGVKISRRPMVKYLPYGLFSKRKLLSQHLEILNTIRMIDFQPDIVIGHWENPQMQLLSLFKNDFPLITTACIIHSKKYFHSKFFPESISKIDKFGFRNDGLLQSFKKIYPILDNRLFLCPSGVPSFFNTPYPLASLFVKHRDVYVSVIFVGLLIKRKDPVILVEATKILLEKININLTIVGEGNERIKILKRAKKLGISDCIHLTGKLNRLEVREQLLKNQIFAMLSRDEAFGLVYLEAMACGCIVIATQGGGVDGIISHGVNGFLCKFGDVSDLTDVITLINLLSEEEKMKIIQNALSTAQSYSEGKISESYLSNVIGIC
jgi:glycosyltransferase involved in cell wall biosynthesis